MNTRLLRGLLVLFVLFCLCAGAAMAEETGLPADALVYIRQAYPGVEIAVYSVSGDSCALALRREGGYTLVLLRKTEAGYAVEVENPMALHADSAPILYLEGASDSLFITYIGQENGLGLQDSVTYHALRGNASGIWMIADMVFRGNWQPVEETFVTLDGDRLRVSQYWVDENDNIIRQFELMPLSAPWLAEEGLLSAFDCSDYLQPPLYDDVSPILARCVRECIPGVESVERACLVPAGLLSICRMDDGTRRVMICESSTGGGIDITTSAPLPDGVSLDTVHSYRNVILNVSGDNTTCLTRQSDGRFSLTNVQGRDIVQLGSDWVMTPEDTFLFGAHPWNDLSTLDFTTIPWTYEQAAKAFDTDGWAVVNNPDPADRLNLHVRADKSAESLGKYYNGAPVRVLERGDEWSRVSVLGVEGYMMTRYLAFGQDMTSVVKAYPELSSLETRENKGTPIYARPDDSQQPVAYATISFYDWIVGLSGSYYHVMERDTGVHGYIRATELWPGNG